MVRVNGHLIRIDGTTVGDFKPDDAEQALHDDEILWLDLHDSSDETLALLRDVFHIHPLAMEDAAEFGQRPKIEEYDHFVSIVFFGANSVGEAMTEVHFFYGEDFLVSIHREPCVAFGAMRQAMHRHPGALSSRLIVLHHALDSLVDSVFPMLAAFDDRVDSLQEQIFEKPAADQLATLFSLKRWLVGIRKVVNPERDMLNELLSQRAELPGMTRKHEPYFRDLYDHLIRISDMVDSHRDLLGNSMDAYMSMMSRRQNDAIKQLTIIATVFLPLSFLTGFFGQNFGWLVRSIGSWEEFFGIGVGTEAVAVIFLLVLFKRRGWFCRPGLGAGARQLPGHLGQGRSHVHRRQLVPAGLWGLPLVHHQRLRPHRRPDLSRGRLRPVHPLGPVADQGHPHRQLQGQVRSPPSRWPRRLRLVHGQVTPLARATALVTGGRTR